MRFLRWLFHSFVLTLNVVCALLFVLSAYSDHVSPEHFLFFSYLGLAFPFFAAAVCGFLLYWLIVGQRRNVLVGLVALMIGWNPLSDYFPMHSRTSSLPQENTLKILSYNVMGFAFQKHTAKSPNPIIRYLAESGADIICLQEYVETTHKDYLTRRKIFRELRDYPYRSIFKSGAKTGIAVFSKFPIRQSREIGYDSKTNRSTRHILDVNGKTITLLNNHLESFKLTMEDRTHYEDFLKSMDKKHFDDLKGTIRQKLGPAFVARARQARAVAEEIRNAETDYVIVCGDFNDTPISYTHHTIKGPLLDAFSKSGCGMGISFHENMFWFRIDNILCSPNIRPYNCTVERIPYSDHYPIWCYLQLAD